MKSINFLKKPRLKNPNLIVAWPGMGEVAFKAARYLIEKLGAEEFANIDPQDFFYLTGSVVKEGLLEITELLAKAAGYRGMVGGQMLDLMAEGRKVSFKELEMIHRFKTGALLTAATRAGALVGGGNHQEVTALTSYGDRFGLAFQVTDDLLDVEGTTEEIGKPAGSDEKHHKATYPALVGLEASRQWAGRLVEEAVAELETFQDRAAPLRELAQYLLVRRS